MLFDRTRIDNSGHDLAPKRIFSTALTVTREITTSTNKAICVIIGGKDKRDDVIDVIGIFSSQKRLNMEHLTRRIFLVTFLELIQLK